MSSALFAEWLAYYQVEPFGEERADLRAGIVASTIANVNRSSKSAKRFAPQDFMPKFTPDDEAERTRRLLAQARAALGGVR